MIPEAQARVQIDQLLQCAGWHACSIDQVNLQAFPGIAIRDCHLNPGQGFADYLLYMNGKACGVIVLHLQGQQVDTSLQRAQSLRQSVLAKLFS